MAGIRDRILAASAYAYDDDTGELEPVRVYPPETAVQQQLAASNAVDAAAGAEQQAAATLYAGGSGTFSEGGGAPAAPLPAAPPPAQPSELDRLRAAYTERVETRRAAMEDELRRLTAEWNALVEATRATDEGGRPQAYWDQMDNVRERLEEQQRSRVYTGPVPTAPAFTGWDPEAWNPITWPGGTKTGPYAGLTFSGGEVVVKVEDAGWMDYNGRGLVQQYRLTAWSGTVYETRLTNERSGGLFSDVTGALGSVVTSVGSAVGSAAGAAVDLAEEAAATPGLASALATVTGGATLLLDNRDEIAQQLLVDAAIGAAAGTAAGVAAGTVGASTAALLGGATELGTNLAAQGAEAVGLDVIPDPPAQTTSPGDLDQVDHDAQEQDGRTADRTAAAWAGGAAAVLLLIAFVSWLVGSKR